MALVGPALEGPSLQNGGTQERNLVTQTLLSFPICFSSLRSSLSHHVFPWLFFLIKPSLKKLRSDYFSGLPVLRKALIHLK